ncbi:hypothetical protein MNBD_NITROSPINAE02-76 [hydrothermal vent metagenome]|uniref:Uncharacterized protein n=1 Tax=hydrothermal vent metagenome TaxID=652676 RepID=A0A3B1BX67_9ZZZZ
MLLIKWLWFVLCVSILAAPLITGDGAYAGVKPETPQKTVVARWDVKLVESGKYCFSQAKLFPGLCVNARSTVEIPVALDWRDSPGNKDIGLFTFKTANEKDGSTYAEHMTAIIDKRAKKVIAQAPLKGYFVGGYWEDEFALENWYEWKWTKNHITVIGEEEGVLLDIDLK